MAAARRRGLIRGAGALLALLLTTLLLPPAALARPGGAGDVADLRVVLTDITPVVTSDDGTARITAEVSNTGTTTVDGVSVSVVTGPSGVSATDWSEADDPVQGSALDTAEPAALGPGEQTTVRLEVDAADLLPGRSWGAAPVSVQVDQAPRAVRTFLGVHRAKEYEPLRMLWGVPVTLPHDRRVVGAPGADREAGWENAVGEGSRVAELTDAGPADGEVWFLDPTVLGSVPEGQAQPDSFAGEREIRDARAEVVRENLDPDATVVLPDADADIAAAAASEESAALVDPQVTSGQELADELGATGDLAWPADGIVSQDRVSAYTDMYGRQPTVVVPSTSLPQDGSRSSPRRSGSGAPLLVADATLSDTVGGLTGTQDAVLARQRVVAETAEILAQMPGTGRSVLVLPGRDSEPDPQAYAQVRDGAADIPWLESATLEEVRAETADAPVVDLPDTVAEAADLLADADPPADPILNDSRATRITRDREALRTYASVRSDGTVWAEVMGSAFGQLASSRWRGHLWSWGQAEGELREEATLTTNDLTVSSGDVNFFADSGRLQITVENHTDVELRNLQVTLEPGRPALRIEQQPEPVTVGPGSRQTVTVEASALAAGNVPIEIQVASPDGEVLTAPAQLDARVRPTGDWIYWVLGGAATLLVVAGVWRTVRRRGDRPVATSGPEGQHG